MVAPNYALKRQELAKKIGLGRKPRIVEPVPAPKAAVEAILDGRQSAELQLDNLLAGFPLEWAGSANPWRSARLKRLVSGATAALY